MLQCMVALLNMERVWSEHQGSSIPLNPSYMAHAKYEACCKKGFGLLNLSNMVNPQVPSISRPPGSWTGDLTHSATAPRKTVKPLRAEKALEKT